MIYRKVVITFSLLVFALSLSGCTSPQSSENSGLTMNKADDTFKTDTLSESRYVEYSKSALDNRSSTRRVLFFYASWCPVCRPADASFKENIGNIPEGVSVIRVNYNDPDTDQEEKDLAKKYAITYQHTFVQIDSSGNEVTRWTGGQFNDLIKKII